MKSNDNQLLGYLCKTEHETLITKENNKTPNSVTDITQTRVRYVFDSYFGIW